MKPHKLLMISLAVLSLGADIQIVGIDPEQYPLRIYCMGGNEEEHILYWCRVDEIFEGDKPSPEMCVPGMKGIPEFKPGERPACPIDGSVPYVRTDFKYESEKDFGLAEELGPYMTILTSKGWMPQRRRP